MFIIDMFNRKTRMPAANEALPGRTTPLSIAENHFVNGRPLKGPWPDNLRTAMFGMGCFWGVERLFWQVPGVYVTAVGYAGGITPNPTYQETCTGLTGHNEVVLVVFDPAIISYAELLTLFWEEHDPTQGMRQGSDIGTTYRSGVYTFSPEQKAAADTSRALYQKALDAAGHGRITTEIMEVPDFYYAEDHHQQYLAKNPAGYCRLRGTGVSWPVLQPKSI
jgi:peptide-methionine (S)-S-oxide reductase